MLVPKHFEMGQFLRQPSVLHYAPLQGTLHEIRFRAQHSFPGFFFFF